MTELEKYLAELQSVLGSGQLQGGNAGGWAMEAARAKAMPGSRQDGGGYWGDADPWAMGITGDTGMSPEEYGQRYQIATRMDKDSEGMNNYRYLLDTQQGNKVLGQEQNFDPKFDIMKDAILPAALVWGGGALASSLLGGGAAAGGVGAGTGTAGAAQTLNPALIESMLATPGYGASSVGIGGMGATGAAGGGLLAAEAGASSAAAPGLAEIGATGLGSAAPAGGSTIAGLGSTAAGVETLAPVFISGASAAPSLLPALTGLGAIGAGLSMLPGVPSVPPAMENLPQADYSNEGRNYSGDNGIDPVGASPAYTGNTPFIDLSGNSFLPDWLKNAGNLVKPVTDALGGLGNLAPIVGAIAGGLEGGKDQTASSEQRIDPRMAQYLYGNGYGDPNSLLGAAQGQWAGNKSGINETMQQGLDMSKAAFTDPAYAQGFQQMRSVGGGLLGGQVAGNPFTQGGGSMSRAGGAGGLLGDPDRYKALMARGRGLIG